MRAMGILYAVITNDSIIIPAGFYVTGFSNLKFAHLHAIFLGFIYVVAILFNCFIIFVIWMDHRLHTPKYIAVANLGFVDLMFSTSFIPSSIKTVITKDTFMSYNACLTQIFFYYCSVTLESYSICVLAYDRLIAICFPLRHTSINTPTSMMIILQIVWLYGIVTVMYIALIFTKLSFCDKLTLPDFVCAYSLAFNLSCNDHTLQFITATTLTILNGFGPVSFIIMSYACILRAVFKMKNVESRYKALSTCTEHLIIVTIFYMATVTLYITELLLVDIDSNVINVVLSLASGLPSCLNPILYSLSTKEIRNRILAILRIFKSGQGRHSAEGCSKVAN